MTDEVLNIRLANIQNAISLLNENQDQFVTKVALDRFMVAVQELMSNISNNYTDLATRVTALEEQNL